MSSHNYKESKKYNAKSTNNAQLLQMYNHAIPEDSCFLSCVSVRVFYSVNHPLPFSKGKPDPEIAKCLPW